MILEKIGVGRHYGLSGNAMTDCYSRIYSAN